MAGFEAVTGRTALELLASCAIETVPGRGAEALPLLRLLPGASNGSTAE